MPLSGAAEAGPMYHEFDTKSQYVEEFANCMAAHGWEPLPGSKDPQASPNLKAVHFLIPADATGVIIGADGMTCRATIAESVGESIIPGL